MAKSILRSTIAALLISTAAHAQAPGVGPLDRRNNLSEIKGGGSAAQAAARANLGMSGVPVTVPTSPLLGGTTGAFVPVTPGAGLSLGANTLSVLYGSGSGTAAQGNDARIVGALQGSRLGAANGVAGLDSGSHVPVAQLPVIPATQLSGLAASATTDTTIANNISSGILPPARLPPAGASQLGGIQAVPGATHQWISSINTAGIASLSQPAASDVSGLAPSATTDTTNATNISSGTLPAARIPTPGLTTLGGIQATATVAHQWVSGINTSGAPVLSQPTASDVSGLGTAAIVNTGTSGAVVPLLNGTNTWGAAQSFGVSSVSGSNFAITGGSLNGVPVGGVTPATGAFTTLGATGNASVGGALNVTGTGNALNITNNAAVGGTLTLGAGSTGGQRIQASGSGNLVVALGGTSSILNFLNGSGTSLLQLGSSAPSVSTFAPLVLKPPTALLGGDFSPGANSAIWQVSTYTGSSTSEIHGVHLSTVNNATGSNGAAALWILADVGANAQGSNFGIDVQSNVNTAASINGNAIAMRATSFVNQNMGGTSGNFSGGSFAFNGAVNLTSGATFVGSATDVEWDMMVQSPVNLKIGEQIVQASGDNSHGITDDVAFDANNQTNATAPWNTIYGIGRHGGGWAAGTNTTLFQAIPTGPVLRPITNGYFALAGFDTRIVDYVSAGGVDGAGFAWVSPGATLTGQGVLTLGGATLTPSQSGLAIAANLVSDGVIGATITPSAGGSGCTVGGIVNGPAGGLFKITGATSGSVAQVTIVTPDWFASGSQPASFKTSGSTCASTPTLTPTWTAASQISLNSNFIVDGSGNLDANSVNATPIGNTTPSTGAFTTLGGTSLNVTNAATVGGTLTTPAITSTGGLAISGTTGGVINFKNGPAGASILQIGGGQSTVSVQTQLVLPGRTWGTGGPVFNSNLFENSTWTGTPGGNISAPLKQLQTSENIDVGSNGEVDALILHNISTAGFTGNRHGLLVVQDINGLPNVVAGAATYTAINSKANLMANMGGTGVTPATAAGAVFGENPVAHIGPLATNIGEIVGMEIDTWAQTGSSVMDKIGAQIVDINGSTVQGARDDVALSLNNQYAPSSTTGFMVGLGFGRQGGFFPVATTGTMISGMGNAGAGFTVANGIDWHLGTATGNWMQLGPSFTVDGAGNLDANSVNATPIGNTTPSTGVFTTVGGTSLNITSAATVGGTLTLGTAGTGGQRIQGTGTANFVIALGGPSSLFNFQTNSGTSLFQITSSGGTTNGQTISEQQMEVRTQGTTTPVWSGSSISAMVPMHAGLTWSGTSAATGSNNPLVFDYSATTTMDSSSSQGAVTGNLTLNTGAGFKGPAHALNIKTTQTATGGQTGNVYTGLNILAEMTANDGGTAPTVGNTGGSLTALNPVAHWGPSATNTTGGSIAEFDVNAQTGSSMLDRMGILIDHVSTDAVQGARDDIGIALDAQGSGKGWKTGLSFGRQGGNPGVASNGKFISATGVGGGTITVANGIDWHLATATGNWFQFGSVASLTGAGTLNVAAYQAGGTAGVTCSGTPTSSFASVNGIVTHC